MQRQILPQETPSTYAPPVLPADLSTTLDVNTALLQEANPETLDTLMRDLRREKSPSQAGLMD